MLIEVDVGTYVETAHLWLVEVDTVRVTMTFIESGEEMQKTIRVYSHDLAIDRAKWIVQTANNANHDTTQIPSYTDRRKSS